jgi:hypothetical protein
VPKVKVQKGKGKGAKAAGVPKVGKARQKVSSPWAIFSKREHSIVWHLEYTKRITLGCSEDSAKEHAGTAGRARTAELRKQRDDGKLTIPAPS